MTELMNAKSYDLALNRTHFSSVSGLEDANNYSTAEDVAALFKEAYGRSVARRHSFNAKRGHSFHRRSIHSSLGYVEQAIGKV